MRGKDEQQLDVFSYVSPEQRVPQGHPLRPLRVMTDEALRELQPWFNKLYAKTGRPSIAPEKYFIRLMFHPNGMKPHVRSWVRTAPILIGCLWREAAAYPGSPSKDLLRELLPGAPAAFIPGVDDAPLAPTVALELEIGDELLRLFNTLTTFGTPQDVTLQELRIEMSFPADDERSTSATLG